MSASLINGNGRGPITAAQDADWFGGIAGGKGVLPIGAQMAASIESATSVRVADGVFVSQGRRIQIAAGDFVDFTIPNGTQGTTRFFIVGFNFRESGDEEIIEPFVQQVSSATATIPETDIRAGATECYFSLYRVTQIGLSVSATAALFTVFKSLADVPFAFGVVNGRYGYYDADGVFQSFKQASGTAIAGNVLAGKTFSNDSAVGIEGTMPERGSVTLTPTGNNTVTAPEGHYDSIVADGRTAYAAGQASRPDKGALTLTPTGNNTATASAGYYSSIVADGRTSYAAGQAKGNGSYTVTLSGRKTTSSQSEAGVYVTTRISGSIVITVTNGVARVTVNNLDLYAYGSHNNLTAETTVDTSIS